MVSRLVDLDAYHALIAHKEEMLDFDVRKAFQVDPKRAAKMSLEACDFFVDYSKNLVEPKTMELLIDLLRASGFKEKLEEQFDGAHINNTEDRAALHTALRAQGKPGSLIVDGQDVHKDVAEVLVKMQKFTERVHSGQWTGFSGKPVKYIVNIGIGGSDLGPKMVVEALQNFASDDLPEAHFVSNVDGHHIIDVLKKVNIEETLFVVASKTFTTQETMTNAESAKAAVIKYYEGNSDVIANHFIALSTSSDLVSKFGIDLDNMFEFWDWVGGRFSMWSAIGLPVAIALGWDQLMQLHQGARELDEHLHETPLENNLPVLLAVIGVWYNNILEWESHAILPYSEHLAEFPAFLQQLDMESNGKGTTIYGQAVDWNTGPIVWGKAGTNGQHAFFQLIHQGTKKISSDFIGFVTPKHDLIGHHHKLLANLLAQTEALMNGKTINQALAEIMTTGQTDKNKKVAEDLAVHKVFKGNHPTTTILLNELNAKTLGSLIALYEQKIFIQGVIWQVNSFDQYGVELGKQLAKPVLDDLTSGRRVNEHDPSTNQLIDYINKNI